MSTKVSLLLSFACFFICFLPATYAAGDIVIGNVTDAFGNTNGSADSGDAAGLLFDEARTGGSDTAAAPTFNPARSLVANSGTNDNWAAGLPVGTAGTVNFTGLGFALRSNTTATQVDVTIRYLGADGAVGGTDDELVGSVSDSLAFSTVSEYVWQFATPLAFDWDGANDQFRFELSTAGTGNLRFKQRSATESPSGQGGLTMSVGGNFVDPIPEPSSIFILGLTTVGFVIRRKRSA